MAVIGIKYVDPDVSTYSGVYLHDRVGGNKEFSTGDFIKDWYDCMKYILTGGLGDYPIVSHSSSVNHFIMDGGSDLYDSAWLLISESGAELTYEYNKEGFEFFVKKGVRLTWCDFKKEYDGSRK